MVLCGSLKLGKQHILYDDDDDGDGDDDDDDDDEHIKVGL